MMKRWRRKTYRNYILYVFIFPSLSPSFCLFFDLLCPLSFYLFFSNHCVSNTTIFPSYLSLFPPSSLSFSMSQYLFPSYLSLSISISLSLYIYLSLSLSALPLSLCFPSLSAPSLSLFVFLLSVYLQIMIFVFLLDFYDRSDTCLILTELRIETRRL